MKKYFLTLGLMSVTALGTLSLRADDTNAAAAAVTNAVAAVSNAKLRAELKYEFRFPDFRAGYAAEIARLAAEEC